MSESNVYKIYLLNGTSGSQETENGEHNSKTIEVRICKMKRSKPNYDPRLGEGALN